MWSNRYGSVVQTGQPSHPVFVEDGEEEEEEEEYEEKNEEYEEGRLRRRKNRRRRESKGKGVTMWVETRRRRRVVYCAKTTIRPHDQVLLYWRISIFEKSFSL